LYDGKYAYVPALEDVLVWDVKKGQMVSIPDSEANNMVSDIFQLSMWHETGHRAEVTCIQRSVHKHIVAVGYADGSIRLWDSSSESAITTFNGHKRSVTALAFDASGTRLASGSQDTDIILWDVVGEAGIFRSVESDSDLFPHSDIF
jgi:U3 small nucleolar RNA-associated protein 12